MPKKQWGSPYYNLLDKSGKQRIIDVTSSIGFGLGPKSVIQDEIVPLFQRKKVRNILDFGAGALRHTIPLLNEGFTVVAVEFEEAFSRPMANQSLQIADSNPNFSALVWPDQFITNKKKFDAALLSYVIQTMPVPKERGLVIKHIFNKLKRVSYLVYLSRYGEAKNLPNSQRINDGYFMNLKHKTHSFYRDYRSDETHDLFK